MGALLQSVEPARAASHKSGAWRICSSLAATQDGMVARRQLLRAGVSRDQIARWVRRGLLYRQHWGIYSVGHEAVTPRGLLRAALLACGDGAVLSHESAAYLWGLVESAPEIIDVTIKRRHCRSRPGLRVRQVQELDPRDLRLRSGLPVTSPSRTIIDRAADVSPYELDRLIAEARASRLIRPGELEAAVDRAGRCRGAAQTRAFLVAEGEPGITRSGGERLLRRRLRQARLAQPLSNAKVVGCEVDFLWRDEKLVVEFDSWQFHGHRRAFESDRRKDVILAGAGYQVLRFTWRQLETEPLVVIAAIAQALGRRAKD
jgi:very-short-patch-repair endonuclease